MHKLNYFWIFSLLIVAAGAFFLGTHFKSGVSLPSLTQPSPLPAQPLEKYSIVNLANYNFQTSHITIEKQLKQTPDFTSYLFSMQTIGKKMTGVLNVPSHISSPQPTIIMIRGYVDQDKYVSGMETEPAAEVFAAHGFMTIAPDFLGYGGSDPESNDQWEARFQKPINVIELLKTVQAEPITITLNGESVATIKPGKIGFWAHSNGGQITLSTLETLQQPYPTSLWAPVTAPFPYSVMAFTNEDPDEGKMSRKWLADFEQIYDVFDFSLTDHLDGLQGTFQLHQGTADSEVPIAWSDDFVAKVKAENLRRKNLTAQIATGSATLAAGENLTPIDLTYFTYPGADHNLRPGWDMVVQRDLEFFSKNLDN